MHGGAKALDWATCDIQKTVVLSFQECGPRIRHAIRLSAMDRKLGLLDCQRGMKRIWVSTTAGYQGANKGNSAWIVRNFLIVAVNNALYSGFNLKNEAILA